MAPVSVEDQVRVKALLTEAITVLCKDGLRYTSQLSIEGLLGITIDRQDIFLVNINEVLQTETGTATGTATGKKEGKKKGKASKRPAASTPKNKPKTPRKRKRKDTPTAGYMKQNSPIGSLQIKQEDMVDYNQMGIDFGQEYQNFETPVTPAPKRKTSRKVAHLNMIWVFRHFLLWYRISWSIIFLIFLFGIFI